MPKKRPPREVWIRLREIVWNRDKRQCQRCAKPLNLREAHIDHLQSGKRGTNQVRGLRCLCRRCHVLRADFRHRGMIASAIRDGITPFDWRPLVWEE